MIKLFRNIRKNLLKEGKTSKYLKYAIGEIILVVIGILIALSINNWNESRKENLLENQLIDILISDLQLKKEECVSDLSYGKQILQQSNRTIQYWENNRDIDTTYLKSLLKILSEDDWFFNESSPAFGTLSNSDLWKKLPDSLIRPISNIYRVNFGQIKTLFAKQTEYATHCKITFLAPNHLLTLHKSATDIQQVVSEKDEEFISLLELLRSGVLGLTTNFEKTIPIIDKLVENLEFYKTSKQK